MKTLSRGGAAVFPIGLLLGLVPWAAGAQSGAPVIPDRVQIELPAGSVYFPGGSAAAPINRNCLTCHSSDMVSNQPPLSEAVWAAEVNKMVKVYHAPVAAADIPAIVAYLAGTKGPK